MTAKNKIEILNEVARSRFSTSTKLPVWAVSLMVGAGIAAAGCGGKCDCGKTTGDTDNSGTVMKADDPAPKTDKVVPVYSAPPQPMNAEPVKKNPGSEPVEEYGVRLPNE
ncbi:hypothetical protein KKF34_05430 [Myxococcota bacterium]|nr:hypothetical protein [Myxococcota bacterium]MBU1379605.1 hypothetical protein [Myxococcota bacterium]MBU1496302.1 hypothetical protein [Myxococcota bacterium]